MVKNFIFGGVLTTVIMFGGLSFSSSALNTDSVAGLGGVNIQKTMDSVCLGNVLVAERDKKSEAFIYKIKKL